MDELRRRLWLCPFRLFQNCFAINSSSGISEASDGTAATKLTPEMVLHAVR